MPEQSIGSATPFPLALILCDSAIVDETSKKKTLVGIFDRILVERFPATHRPLTIYARLTDAEGRYDFRVDYVQVKTDKILAQGKLAGIDIPDRLTPFEILLTPPPIPIPEPGQYEFRVWANGRYVGRVAFTVEEAPTTGGQS